MKKRIVVVYYTLSGELLKSLVRIIPNSVKNKYDLKFLSITPCKRYIFPCTWHSFFEVFVDSVLQNTCPLKPVNINVRSDDIIILAFQPWFLFPSIPFNSFIKSESFKSIIGGKRVVLFMVCRNTWINCLEIVRQEVLRCRGQIISEVVIPVHTASKISGAHSFLKWVFTGSNSPFDLLVQEKIDVLNNCLHKVLVEERYDSLADLNRLSSYYYECRVVKSYKKWARLIQNSTNKIVKHLTSILFQIWLVFALLFISPLYKLLTFKQKQV